MRTRAPTSAALSAGFLVVVAGLALPACQGTDAGAGARAGSGGGPALSAADRTAIAANSADWLAAVRKADWSAVAAAYTQDAMLLPPEQPAVAGRDAIAKWFAAFPPIISMELDDQETDGRGDVAYVRGAYRLVVAPPGAGTVRETGKYIEIRRRQPDGSWLKLRDMFSPDEAKR